jgi:hypothetical protein
VPTGDSFRARFKYPYIIIHRIDLHNVMLDACSRDPLVTLVPDAMVSRFTDHGDRVTSSPRSFHFPLQPLRPHDARANSSTKVRCSVVGLRSCAHLLGPGISSAVLSIQPGTFKCLVRPG